MADPLSSNGTQMTPTSMAVKGIANALQNNQALARFLILLFALYPFVDNIYAKIQDAGLVHSVSAEIQETLETNHNEIVAHSNTMKFQGEASLRIKLADCTNNAVAVAGGNLALQTQGVRLCLSSIEQVYKGDPLTLLPSEMARMMKELMNH